MTKQLQILKHCILQFAKASLVKPTKIKLHEFNFIITKFKKTL